MFCLGVGGLITACSAIDWFVFLFFGCSEVLVACFVRLLFGCLLVLISLCCFIGVCLVVFTVWATSIVLGFIVYCLLCLIGLLCCLCVLC